MAVDSLREQARSHMDLLVHKFVFTESPVGAGLLAKGPAQSPQYFQADTTNNPTINPIPTNHTNDRKIAQSAR